jgi:prephenate dehydrogenase
MDTVFRKKIFGFIGLGLIGGSIARCIRLRMPDAAIIAYNYYETRKHPRLEAALADGVVSCISTELEDFSQCDVIFLCAPVLTNIAYVKRLKPYLKPSCILTDVGSVKGQIYHCVSGQGLSSFFIGGHPMAGTEKTGYEHSFPELLKDCYYILTPTKEVSPDAVAWMQDFVKHIVCAKAVTIEVEEHDMATAGISHVPHIVSAALVNAVADRDNKGIYRLLAAGGFKDITRISSSSPEMWENICLSNKDAILDFMDSYIEIFEQTRDMIAREDDAGIRDFFARAKSYRDQLLHQ